MNMNSQKKKKKIPKKKFLKKKRKKNMIDGNITGSKVEGSILILIFMNDDFVIYQVLSILLDGLIRSINITILPSIGKKKKLWFEL